MKKLLLLSAAAIGFTQCQKGLNQEQNMDEKEVVAFDVNHMDSSVSPCENFYTYAIGSWQKDNPVPSTESRWMAFNILHDENKKKLQGILDEMSQLEDAAKGSDEQLIRDLYLSALDTNGNTEIGLAPLKPFLEKINAISTVADLNRTLGELAPNGIGGPMGIYVTVDRKNSNAYVVGASQSGMSLPDRDYYLSDDAKMVDIRQKYVNHVNRIFSLAEMPSEGIGERVLALETKIADISWPRQELRIAEKTYNRYVLTEWNEGLDNIDAAIFMEAAGYPQVDEIVVGQPSFFEKMDELMSEIPLEEWKTWMTWKVLRSYSSAINDEFEKANFEFYSTELRGVKEMKPRDERILERIDGNMGEPLGKLFVKQYFPPESKEYVAEMIENLRSAYRESINNLDWMGDSTKEKALKKLDAFTYKIGYPDKWEDYSSLEISPNGYVGNLINIRNFGYKLMLDKLGKPVDKEEWHMNPQMVNAYYNPVGNEVVFPAGILQPPFFHPEFDASINYGGIGAVIGHEFTHGFDDQGSKYDWDGNMNNWWTEEDRTRFDSLASVLVDQFNAVEVLPGKHINGTMTLGENIADLGGLTLAYGALKMHLNGQEPEPIDGYTWQQRFFLGWANVWKGNITEKELENRLLTDYHSPAEYRVRVPLQNLSEFQNAFSCEPPVDLKTVKIW